MKPGTTSIPRRRSTRVVGLRPLHHLGARADRRDAIAVGQQRVGPRSTVVACPDARVDDGDRRSERLIGVGRDGHSALMIACSSPFPSTATRGDSNRPDRRTSHHCPSADRHRGAAHGETLRDLMSMTVRSSPSMGRLRFGRAAGRRLVRFFALEVGVSLALAKHGPAQSQSRWSRTISSSPCSGPR